MSELLTYDQIDELVDVDTLKLRDLAWELTSEVKRLRAQRDKMLALCDATDSPEVEVARSVIFTDDIRAVYAEPTSEATS